MNTVLGLDFYNWLNAKIVAHLNAESMQMVVVVLGINFFITDLRISGLVSTCTETSQCETGSENGQAHVVHALLSVCEALLSVIITDSFHIFFPHHILDLDSLLHILFPVPF